LHNAEPKDNFYDRNSSSRWIRELKNVIIVPPKNESATDSFNIQSPGNIYIGAEGRTITQIRIVRMKPFGTSLTDTSAHHITWLGKAGNAVHITTLEFIIRNALLFSEGDTINSFKLADSERYLRSLRYIDDASVTAVAISDSEAEVTVTVQDILPYSLGFGTNFASRANFSLTNRNNIGLGIETHAGAFIDAGKERLMGYEARLRMPNIGRTFVSLQADYLDRYENQRYGFTVTRDFYAPTTRYAGHLTLYNARTPVRYSDPEGDYPEITAITIRYNHLDVWLGRSFQIDRNPFNRQRKNFTVSLGAQRVKFVDRPENAEESYYRFQNRTTYLASLTYSQQAHYKTNLIYNFGRTEDIPYGFLLSAVSGKEVNELYNRPYIGANFSSGYFIPKFGYLSGAISYGTFFHKGADQGAVDFELNYFTNLYVLGKFRQRTFINGQYTRQLYNRLDDQLVIDGDFGIPGFRNDSVLGRHRFNLSLEQDLFTPWDLYGFKFVVYAFSNFSWLGGYDTPIMLSSLYSSFGLGVRIRNNRLIFDTFQIQFAYFPNIPENSRFRYVHLSKETMLQPRDFKPTAPDIMPLY
jgi:outer membrane protein assembly factor BamA